MIKSIIVVSILFLTVSTSPESYAQESDEANVASSGHAVESASRHNNPTVATAGDQAIIKTQNSRTSTVPLVKLFPYRDPVALHTTNTNVVPPATPSRQDAPGLQHEFHGVISSTLLVPTITDRKPV
ncbi:MAG: hypothetical protein HXX11_21405 [Desulfuromonadales bacterium]|nr:hypothetical protein [Desulfuromonadales bacterium]